MSPQLSREIGRLSATPTVYEARMSGDWTRIIDHLEAGGTLAELSDRHRAILKTARDEAKNLDAAWERHQREVEDEFDMALREGLRRAGLISGGE